MPSEAREPECEVCRRCDKERDRIGANSARIATALEALAVNAREINEALTAYVVAYTADANVFDDAPTRDDLPWNVDESKEDQVKRLARNAERQAAAVTFLRKWTQLVTR